MTQAPPARLAFLKLNVGAMEPALAFWQQAFGFEIAATYDLPHFLEHVLARPGADRGGLSLMLVEHRPPLADAGIGAGHGPVGLVVEDIAASHAHALGCGAQEIMAPADVGGAIVSLLASPQGHAIELVQLQAEAG